MVQTVQTHFETGPRQRFAQCVRDAVVALGHQIERGTELVVLLGFHQGFDTGETARALDIVREDHGETFAARPAGPVGRHGGSPRTDWPDIRPGKTGRFGPVAAQRDPDPPGEKRFDQVVSLREHHC